MKKVLSIFLVAILCGTMLIATTGCTKNGDWAYIEEKGEVVIGITIFNPMNYKDADDKLVGFDTELAEAVCQKLGVKPKFVEINWKTKEAEIKSRTIDLIWNGFTVTDERRLELDFSNSYMNNTQTAVIRKEDVDKYTTLDSMKNAKITAEIGSAGESAFHANEIIKNATFLGATKQTTCLLEVLAKTQDIAIVDSIMAVGTINSGGDFSNLVILSDINLVAEEYAIGFRKNSPIFVGKVNVALKELYDDGTILEIAKKYGVDKYIIAQN